MKKLRKKGFTLIELMIVLAIIAILAVVLIPKAATMKDNSKNAGVATNVNTVRALLETKIADGTYYGATGATKLVTALDNATVASKIVNPFDKIRQNVVLSTDTDTDTTKASVIVKSVADTTPINTDIDKANKGTVYVYVGTNQFFIFGVNSDGTAANAQTIK